MQCNTNYTGSSENFKYININVLKTFKKKFKNIILGLSDHTPGHTTVLGSITLGARVVEKHFTINKKYFGPDHKASISPKELKVMIKSIRNIEIAMGERNKKVTRSEKGNITVEALKN